MHDKGVTNPPSGKEGTSYEDTSVPRTKLTPGAEDGMIPLRMLKTLRRELRRVYPELGEKDFVYTRLCWYVDPFPPIRDCVLPSISSGLAERVVE